MEEPREKQQSLPPAAPPPHPAGYLSTQQVPANYQPATPNHALHPAHAVRMSRLTMIRRLARLLLRRILYAGVMVWRVLRPRLLTVAIVGVLLCIIAIQSVMLLAQQSSRAGDAAGLNRAAATIPPPPAVETFLRGQREYDADLMWGTFSDSLKAALSDRGFSKSTWQNQADRERQMGVRYVGYEYIAGLELHESRESVFFYLVDREIPSTDRAGATSYVFFVDQDGKISRIE